MHRLLVSFFLILLLVFAFSQETHKSNKTYLPVYRIADSMFRKAEQLSNVADYTDEIEKKEDELNRQALAGFKKILPAIEQAKDDSLAFYCYYKIGVLEHYYDSLIPAKRSYEMAVSTKKRLPSFPDSLLFKPYLFIGGIQYSNNQFDSALLNYKNAEEIAGKYKATLDGTNRLYNTLGAMYFETGNYSQAKNYFEKAIALLGPVNPSDGLLINYKINLAATLTRLEDFDKANSIYQELLSQDINKNDILHNLGTINLRLGAAAKALTYFKQVTYTNNKIVRLKNETGQAYDITGQTDSAKYYYEQAIIENKKWNRNIKNVQAGLTLKYLGDIDSKEGDYQKALEKYQRAIIQLANDFNSENIYENPERYSEVFSYINLFYLLTAKAEAFEKLYQQGKDIKDLEASLDAYRFAFKLADYVEKTYDSDEARLFLNKIKYTAHSKPIDISLLLYDLTQKREFLEDAYLFDQRNKASILALKVRENEWRKDMGDNNDLFHRQSSIKAAITRLSLKASQTTDSTLLASLKASIRDNEIALGKLREKINADPAYNEKQLTDRIPPVDELQKKLDNATALLSYHLSGNKLLVLFITPGKYEYYSSAIDKDFFLQIDSLKISLHTVTSDQKYNGSQIAMSLYQKLLAPLSGKLSNKDHLIIIPDDELNYLPFEALQNENGEYLVQKFSIQYQYSTSLFATKKNVANTATLAFAPFTNIGYTDSLGSVLSSLPASKEEVQNLEGKIFVDSAATKQHFLEAGDHYGIIHFATHASVNNESPLRSFINFYPGKNDEDHKLYAGEIYNLDLDSTQLIILSACETGAGKLIKGEGLMSLSRAFAYAGCPNIITSLWKAEDKTTAFITKRIHQYLQKGFTKDRALQQAKLDLLNSDEIDPRYKSPPYWAHLVFIGQYERPSSLSNWWWIAGGILLVTGIYLFFKRKRS